VELELFSPVACPTTTLFWVSLALFATPPHLELIVLTILVSLPVIFAAESLEALWEGAAIWLIMALLMFSVFRSVNLEKS
jgi:hypothetical protein